jgi:hypothetical protein
MWRYKDRGIFWGEEVRRDEVAFKTSARVVVTDIIKERWEIRDVEKWEDKNVWVEGNKKYRAYRIIIKIEIVAKWKKNKIYLEKKKIWRK